jgi:hypothetical protein
MRLALRLQNAPRQTERFRNCLAAPPERPLPERRRELREVCTRRVTGRYRTDVLRFRLACPTGETPVLRTSSPGEERPFEHAWVMPYNGLCIRWPVGRPF